MRGRGTLLVDCDYCLWDSFAIQRRVCREMGIDEDAREPLTWAEPMERYGEGPAREMFRRVMCPTRMPERAVFAGAREALMSARSRLGLDIVVLSHAYDPAEKHAPLSEWLRGVALRGVPFRLECLSERVPKVERADRYGAVGIIDDRPETLLDFAKRGLVALAKRRPLNDPLVRDDARVWGFDDWRVVPSMLEEALRERAGYGGAA